jgi:hypothetical protein
MLSLRYAMGWYALCLFFLALSPFVGLSDSLGDLLGVQPITLLLGVPLITLVAVCFQLSISVSGLTERVRVLAEEVAISNALVLDIKNPDRGREGAVAE